VAGVGSVDLAEVVRVAVERVAVGRSET